MSSCIAPIRQVLIYSGHHQNPLLGPYPANIVKRVQMFELLNKYRKEIRRPEWSVVTVPGENLIEALKRAPCTETLLVIPAGQSTRLDKVFSIAETVFLKEEFFKKGGRGYLNCGSAYWVSRIRRYLDLCEEQPETAKPIVKSSNLELFDGEAVGPLCPYPGKQYKVGFFSDAVQIVTPKQESCSIYLSGGGSFLVDKQVRFTERATVLARYPHAEMMRQGVKEAECKKLENAVIMTTVGRGAALLSMFHPYYGAHDFDVELYLRTFPHSGTDWVRVRDRLSPLDVRMRFVLHNMLLKLEDYEFEG